MKVTETKTEIKIKRLTKKQEDNRENPFGKTHRYSVTENNRCFTILYKINPHGHSLCMEGKKGNLYCDMDKNEVRIQSLSIGIDCGLRYESDEPVEGLSILALRGVIFAEKHHQNSEITIFEKSRKDSKTEVVLSIDGMIMGTFDEKTLEVKPENFTSRD